MGLDMPDRAINAARTRSEHLRGQVADSQMPNNSTWNTISGGYYVTLHYMETMASIAVSSACVLPGRYPGIDVRIAKRKGTGRGEDMNKVSASNILERKGNNRNAGFYGRISAANHRSW